MKIIDSYILKECRGPIILSVSIFTFIFLLDIIVAMMENIIVKGISVFDVARILSFYVPPILTQTIPLGLFVGIMITFSKFTRSSEFFLFPLSKECCDFFHKKHFDIVAWVQC